MTSRSLKFAAAESLCGKDYAAGSTLGGGSFLLLWLLINFPAPGGNPFDTVEVKAFVRSIARLTSRSLKFAVAESLCGKNLRKQVLFAGYSAGSTLGGGSLLLLWLLINAPAPGGNPSDTMEAKAFVCSIARLA
jgi:hypothetical protein